MYARRLSGIPPCNVRGMADHSQKIFNLTMKIWARTKHPDVKVPHNSQPVGDESTSVCLHPQKLKQTSQVDPATSVWNAEKPSMPKEIHPLPHQEQLKATPEILRPLRIDDTSRRVPLFGTIGQSHLSLRHRIAPPLAGRETPVGSRPAPKMK